jgi:hypothetical protein
LTLQFRPVLHLGRARAIGGHYERCQKVFQDSRQGHSRNLCADPSERSETPLKRQQGGAPWHAWDPQQAPDEPRKISKLEPKFEKSGDSEASVAPGEAASRCKKRHKPRPLVVFSTSLLVTFQASPHLAQRLRQVNQHVCGVYKYIVSGEI